MSIGTHAPDQRQILRFAGLCAITQAVLTILNAFVLSPGGPGDPNQPASELVAVVQDGYGLGAVLDALGVGIFVIFVIIVGRLAEPRGGWLSSAMALMAVSWFAVDVVWAGAELAFAAEAKGRNGDANAAKAIFLFDLSLLVTIAVPIAILYLTFGLLILTSRVLPVGMGWSAMLVAVVTLASVITGVYTGLDLLGFAAFVLATILWPLVAGILLFMRGQRVVAGHVPAATR